MNGLICDNCGTVLALDAANGVDDEMGERAAWIVVKAGRSSYDACTRSCATALLADGSELAAEVDAHMEVIADIARTIRDDDGAGDQP